jgi:hypothetical protein
LAILQTLYVSKARLPAGDEFAALADIIDTSLRRNAAAGLTGCLGYCGEHFVQILEGSAEAVEATLARITADPRHVDMTVRLRREVRNRSFPDWRMAQADIAAAAPEMSGADLMSTPPALLISLLLRIAESVGPASGALSPPSKTFASADGRR